MTAWVPLHNNEVQENWPDMHFAVSLHIILYFNKVIKALSTVFQIKITHKLRVEMPMQHIDHIAIPNWKK